LIRPDKVLWRKATIAEKSINPLGERTGGSCYCFTIDEIRQYIVTYAGSEEVPNTGFDEPSQ